MWACLGVAVECGSAFCRCGMVGGLSDPEVHVCGKGVCMDWEGVCVLLVWSGCRSVCVVQSAPEGLQSFLCLWCGN